MSALVIKSWKSGTKPIDDQNNFVNITGREGGAIAWVLSLMGIDPTTTILVGLDRIEFSSSSLEGTASRLIPLQNICSTYYGYHKPWKSAISIMTALMLIGISIGSILAESGAHSGVFTSFTIFSVLGAFIAIVYYFLNITLTLGFVEHSGIVNGIRFKRSVIENIEINQEQAKAVCIIIQRLIEFKEKRTLQAVK